MCWVIYRAALHQSQFFVQKQTSQSERSCALFVPHKKTVFSLNRLCISVEQSCDSRDLLSLAHECESVKLCQLSILLTAEIYTFYGSHIVCNITEHRLDYGCDVGYRTQNGIPFDNNTIQKFILSTIQWTITIFPHAYKRTIDDDNHNQIFWWFN